MTKEVKSTAPESGKGGCVYVPKRWIGKNVKVTLLTTAAAIILMIIIASAVQPRTALAADGSGGTSNVTDKRVCPSWINEDPILKSNRTVTDKYCKTIEQMELEKLESDMDAASKKIIDRLVDALP